jgi:hypothetical protein
MYVVRRSVACGVWCGCVVRCGVTYLEDGALVAQHPWTAKKIEVHCILIYSLEPMAFRRDLSCKLLLGAQTRMRISLRGTIVCAPTVISRICCADGETIAPRVLPTVSTSSSSSKPKHSNRSSVLLPSRSIDKLQWECMRRRMCMCVCGRRRRRG